MEFRNNNVAVGNSFKSTSDLAVYLRYILEVFQASEINRKLWLTEREKDFYIPTIMNVLHGQLNPIEDEALIRYQEYFDSKITKAKVADYVGRLRRKNWVKYDKFEKDIILPPIFRGIDMKGDKLKITLDYDYNGSAVD